MSHKESLARRLRGGVGTRLGLDFTDRGLPFLENIPCVQDLTTFLFFRLTLRSGDVFGLVESVA